MASGRAWEESRQGASVLGLGSQSSFGTGVAMLQAGLAAGPPDPSDSIPQIMAGHHESLLGGHSCLQALMGVGRPFLHSGVHSTAGALAAPLCPLPLATPFSRQPVLCSPINRSHSLGPQSRQDPGEVDLEVGEGHGQGQQAPSKGLGQRLSSAPSGSRSWQEAQAQSQPHRLIRD